MTRFPDARDPVDALTRPDGSTEPHELDHGRIIGPRHDVQHYGAQITSDAGNAGIQAANRAAINEAVANADADGGTVVFPGGDGAYVIDEPITLSTDDVGGQHWVGEQRVGGVLQFSYPPTVSIWMPSGTGPIVDIDGGASESGGNHTFENINFFGREYGVKIFAAARMRFKNCGFTATQGGSRANSGLYVENSFWLKLEDCNFHAPASGGSSVYFLASNASSNAIGVGITQWDNCIFVGPNGGIYYSITHLASSDFELPYMSNCLSEASGKPLFEVVEDGSLSSSWFIYGGKFDHCSMADATSGSIPLVKLTLGTHGKWGGTKFENSQPSGNVMAQVATAEAGSEVKGVLSTGNRNDQYWIQDSLGNFIGAWTELKGRGMDMTGTSDDVTESDLQGKAGPLIRLAKEGERHASVGLEPGTGSSSGLRLGPGGAGGTFDVDLYREAANVLATDDKLHVALELELDGALNHDGSTVGFYGTAPVAKQTGVAVTAAALHAALVNLGLISA